MRVTAQRTKLRVSRPKRYKMRLHGTFRRVQQIHKSRGSLIDDFTRGNQTTRSGVPKTGGCQSQSARSQAWHKTTKEKDGHAAFRFPRPCLLKGNFRFFVLLRRQLRVGQPLADDLRTQQTEAVRIGNLLFLCSAVVIAKSLFIHVTEQVKRFHVT
jgi:hypothetical protein